MTCPHSLAGRGSIEPGQTESQSLNWSLKQYIEHFCILNTYMLLSYWVTACMKARPRTGLRLIVYGIKNSGVYLGKQFQGCSVI